MQSKAIDLLGELSTKKAISVLEDIVDHAEIEGVRRRAEEALKKALNEVPSDIREPAPETKRMGVGK